MSWVKEDLKWLSRTLSKTSFLRVFMSSLQCRKMKNGSLKRMKVARFCTNIGSTDQHWPVSRKSPTQKSRALWCEGQVSSGNNTYRQPQPRPSAQGSQQKALPLRITAFAGSTLHWQAVLHWHLMRSVVMVTTGLGQFLSMPDERVSTGGGPTSEVRFNVHLCVAKMPWSPRAWNPLKQAVRTAHAPSQYTTGNWPEHPDRTPMLCRSVQCIAAISGCLIRSCHDVVCASLTTLKRYSVRWTVMRRSGLETKHRLVSGMEFACRLSFWSSSCANDDLPGIWHWHQFFCTDQTELLVLLTCAA